MGVLVFGLEFKRSVGDREGLEALVEGDFLVEEAVTADGVKRSKFAREGVDDIVVIIPSTHLERLLGVEVIVRIGSSEVGQAEDALVDDGQRIGHGLGVLFLHGDLDLLLGVGGLGDVKHRLQLKLAVLHLDRHHAIHTQRHVVARVARLDQRDIDVHVGDHLLGGLEFHLALSGQLVEHHGLEDLVVGFDRHQGLCHLVGGEVNHHVVANLIGILAAAHGQLYRTFGITGGVDGSVIPVKTHHLSESVATLLVGDDKEVQTPLLVRHVELQIGLAVIAGQGSAHLGTLVGASHILAK